MENWKIGYYAFLIVCLVTFVVLIFYNVLIAVLFAIVALFVSNRFISSKEPQKMADLNRSVLPMLLLFVSALSTMFLFAFVFLPSLLPYPFSSLIVLISSIPGILMCFMAFHLSKNELSLSNQRFWDAFKMSLILLPAMSMGTLPSALSTNYALSHLEKNDKMTPGTARIFFAYGMSALLIVAYLLSSALWFALIILFAKH